MRNKDVVRILGPASPAVELAGTRRVATIEAERYGRPERISYWELALAPAGDAPRHGSEPATRFAVAISDHGLTTGPRFTAEVRCGDLERRSGRRPVLRGPLVAREDFDLRGRPHGLDPERAAFRRIVAPIVSGWRAVRPLRLAGPRAVRRDECGSPTGRIELWLDERVEGRPQLLLVGQRYDRYAIRVSPMRPLDRDREPPCDRAAGWWGMTVWRCDPYTELVGRRPLIVRRVAERAGELVPEETIRGAIALLPCTSASRHRRPPTWVSWASVEERWLAGKRAK